MRACFYQQPHRKASRVTNHVGDAFKLLPFAVYWLPRPDLDVLCSCVPPSKIQVALFSHLALAVTRRCPRELPFRAPQRPPEAAVLQEEASFTTGRRVGLIYREANKRRKPLWFACVRGLRLVVNGNIHLVPECKLTLMRRLLRGHVHTPQQATPPYYVSTARKTTIPRILDLIQLCSAF